MQQSQSVADFVAAIAELREQLNRTTQLVGSLYKLVKTLESQK